MNALRPPYLVTPGSDRRELSVSCTADASGAVVEMSVRGRWTDRLGDQVSERLRGCLAGPPTSVIVDLHGLGDPQGLSMPFWLTLWRTARLGPAPVRILLCLPVTAMLDHRLRRFEKQPPRLFATLPEARAAATGPGPWTHRLQVRLTPEPDSVRAARDLAAEACHTWQLPHLRNVARLVMSELATNAVTHARTDFVATVSRGGPGLHLAVRDGAFAFPRPSEPVATGEELPLNQSGNGLRVVHAASAAWGAMPARGGKVVWAALSAPSYRSAGPGNG